MFVFMLSNFYQMLAKINARSSTFFADAESNISRNCPRTAADIKHRKPIFEQHKQTRISVFDVSAVKNLV